MRLIKGMLEMTREDITETIHNWLLDNKLYYYISPMNDERVDEYMERLEDKLPELYRVLRELDIIPKDSYHKFVSIVESGIYRGRQLGALH